MHRRLVIPALSLGLLAQACAPESPEAQVRRLIERAERAAEARRLDELTELVSPRYSDGAGRDRAALTTLLRGYLAAGGTLHLLTRVDSLSAVSPERVEVRMLVATASVPISGVADLERLSADLLRVELTMEKERRDWRLTRASWKRAGLRDFL
jgi:hypothetical protein